ncbi:Dethiobiotin synthetase [invertebrate metagenome]|uniref:Dethiobiotin synthetase n=1 Tax=invertebrate metagenome TaxID=1711999 RepID=A0A484H6Q8_9ZZZZ
MPALQGLFVTGTDTHVGKTVVAACLVRAFAADYWKPVQSGLISADDSATVLQLAGVSADRVHPCFYGLQAPLAPHEAARREGIQIVLDHFRLPKSDRPVVVEGAGGVLVPLNEQHLMIDLMVHLSLPVILVARSSLGTINHTLLSLAALRNRGLMVLDVIMNGPSNPANRVALENHGRISVKELPWVNPVDAAAIASMTSFLA